MLGGSYDGRFLLPLHDGGQRDLGQDTGALLLLLLLLLQLLLRLLRTAAVTVAALHADAYGLRARPKKRMQVLTPNKKTRKRVKQKRAAAVKLLCSAAPIAGVRMSKFRDGQGLEKTEHDAQIELKVTYAIELVSCSRAMRAMCLRYTRV